MFLPEKGKFASAATLLRFFSELGESASEERYQALGGKGVYSKFRLGRLIPQKKTLQLRKTLKENTPSEELKERVKYSG